MKTLSFFRDPFGRIAQAESFRREREALDAREFLLESQRLLTEQPARAQQSILPAFFGGDPSVQGFRRLTGQSNGQAALRDLPLPTHERAQQLAYFLYLANPMAQWLINIQTAYIVGEGVTLNAKDGDEDVQAVIDDWWEDDQNDWDSKLEQKVRELSLYGEQCWTAFTAQGTGRVRLGYLDPWLIDEVVLSPDDAEQPIGVITKRYAIDGAEIPQRRLKVVTALSDEELGSAAMAMRARFADGDCFYYAVNKVSNGSRGWSDLLARADWLDGYEQFMFQRLERADLGNRVVADITLTGMTPDQLAAYAKSFIPPKAGGHFFHNEKVTYDIKSPDMHASDAREDSRLFKHQAISGLPEHWFGGGGDTNRATAAEMDEPTYKLFQQRQKSVKGIVQKTARYAVRQAKVWGRVPQGASEKVNAEFPSMVRADLSKLGAAMQSLAASLATAVTQQIIFKAEARRIYANAVERLGVELDDLTDAELDDLAAQDQLAHDSQDYRTDPAMQKKALAAKAAQAMKRIK